MTVAGQGIRLLLQLGGVVILSRLLSPEDFGLIAMVAVFMSLADLVRDFGLSGAALQAKSLTDQQSSNLFWASAALGVIAAGVLVAVTPLIVALYGEPRLGLIVPSLAVVVVISGFQAQVQVHLARRHKFSLLALSAVIAPAVGLAVAIVATPFGYWALVLQPIAAALVLLGVQALSARWIPKLPRRNHQSRALFRSGGQLGSAYVLTWAAGNVDAMLAGSRWGAIELGYYNRAYQLTAMLVGGLLGPLTQVAIPMLNEASRLGKNVSRMLLRLQFVVAAPISIAMVSIAVSAPTLIPLLLGDEWVSAVGVVVILAIGECFHVLSFISYWGFLSQQLSKQLLYYNLLTKPVAVILLVVGSSWGIEGIAWAYVAGLAMSWPIGLAWLAKVSQLGGAGFLVSGMRTLGAAGAAFAFAYVAYEHWLCHLDWIGIILVGVLVSIAYIGFTAIFRGGRGDLAGLLATIRSFR